MDFRRPGTPSRRGRGRVAVRTNMMEGDVESPGFEDSVSRTQSRTPKPVAQSTASIILMYLGTTLAVTTYLEDAVRSIFNWDDQVKYAGSATGMPIAVSYVVLALVTIVQVASPLIVVPASVAPALARPIMALCMLLSVTVVIQPFLFSQLSNSELVILLLAQLGVSGLVFAEAHFVAFPRRNPFAAHMAIEEVRQSAELVPWMQLMSRMLLTIDLAVDFGARLLEILFGSSSTPHATSSLSMLLMSTTYLLVLLSGVMVWVGFKTEFCACVIALAAFIDAFVRYPFWLAATASAADVERFHFFQMMAPVGGFLLLVALGPGRFSIDRQAKAK